MFEHEDAWPLWIIWIVLDDECVLEARDRVTNVDVVRGELLVTVNRNANFSTFGESLNPLERFTHETSLSPRSHIDASFP
jgi:hypothetical protein